MKKQPSIALFIAFLFGAMTAAAPSWIPKFLELIGVHKDLIGILANIATVLLFIATIISTIYAYSNKLWKPNLYKDQSLTKPPIEAPEKDRLKETMPNKDKTVKFPRNTNSTVVNNSDPLSLDQVRKLVRILTDSPYARDRDSKIAFLSQVGDNSTGYSFTGETSASTFSMSYVNHLNRTRNRTYLISVIDNLDDVMPSHHQELQSLKIEIES